MRIISPSGRLFKISSVDPCVEAQYELNGMKHNASDVAKDMGMKPTGLRFHIACEDKLADPNIYVGNLATEKVQEIMQFILKEKYYDLSKLSYQKEDLMGKYIIDAGNSLPYYSEVIFEHMRMATYRPKFPMLEEEDD